MTKGLKYLGEENGFTKFEEYEVVEVTFEQSYNYNQLVTEYIREKYSQDDEFALNSKSMHLYLNNCTEEQRAKWILEIKEFADYREQCIAKAKVICNLQ